MASERAILHCDMNSFYASCEAAYNPKLQGKPIAVCGDPERRNGIVLTASYPAKWMGVKTGMPLWEAQQHCRDIIFVPAHYDLYTRYSGYTREIFLRFTDQVKEESRCFPKIHVMQCRRNLASAGQGSSLKYPDRLAFAPILLIPYRCVFID